MTTWADSSDEYIEEKKICVDVGGFCFFTTHKTLSNASYFDVLKTDQDYIFVDRDASTFSYILNFLRTGKIFLKTDDTTFLNWLRNDANFYGIPDMSDIITKQCKESSHMTDLVTELKHIVQILNKTPLSNYMSNRENRSMTRKSLIENTH